MQGICSIVLYQMPACGCSSIKGRAASFSRIKSAQGSLKRENRMATKSKSIKVSKAPAVAYMFDDASNALCPVVRADVDAVLGAASDNGITPTTSNDDLLSHYIPSDDVQALYILLNRRLAKSNYPGFTPFGSSDIKSTASIGDVRSAAYSHCGGITCSHI
jgi:hypothetical protein